MVVLKAVDYSASCDCTYLTYLMPTTTCGHTNCCITFLSQVVFVDYGNEEMVRQDSLCEMPLEYYQYPMQVHYN